VLAEATAALEDTSDHAIRDRSRACDRDHGGPRSVRMHRGYANLQQALEDAQRAAAAARPLASRALKDG
jgi:hypothetical protein